MTSAIGLLRPLHRALLPSQATMKTSRISRQTARVVDALSPSELQNGSLRRSLRGFGNQEYEPDVKVEQDDDHDSGLSTPPSSPEIPRKKNGIAAATLGKRKRTTSTKPTTSATKLSAELATSTPRRSPRKAPKLESDDENERKVKKGKRQPAKRISGRDGSITISPPANWEEVYSITAEMRQRVLAPVDTMGCESLADETRSPRDKRLQTLIALMLSSQTKDTVTAAAIRNLQDNLEGGFTLGSLLEVKPERLNELIAKVGFHNNKTKYIKATASILSSDFDGDIPDTIEGLVSLPGVGPKMAYLCMSSAWGRDEGIGVDVHVHRITNLWGWHKTSTPEQTRAELESWLPREKWHDINHLLVGFGQTICLPVGRRCGECELSAKGLCPSAVASSPVKRKAKRKVEVDDGEVKEEVVKVERDDVGIKVEAEVDGEEREAQALAGATAPEKKESDDG